MVSKYKGSNRLNKAVTVQFDRSQLNSILDEDGLYEKIGKILNQLDVPEINNEIETQNSKIENEAEKYFRKEDHVRFTFRWFILDKICLGFLAQKSLPASDRDTHSLSLFLCFSVKPSLMDFQYYNNEGAPPTILSFMS